jgi:non-specific serine/threonine protein kinase
MTQSMAENAGSFGELLKRYRGRAGLTQEELAEAAGLSVRGLSDLERGVVSAPRAGTLRLLARALQLAPEDEALWEAARKRGAGEGPYHRPDERREASSRDNLPVSLTSFVGRLHDLATVEQLLGRTRLLTLTGPGGVGKTRLAVQVAAACLEEYAQGAWLVELAPLGDPALVPAAVAGVLGIFAEAHRPLVATLSAVLRPKRLLLVLDNCEHLVAACAALAEALLQACPQLRILATSREALNIAGEVAWPVPSLEVPQGGQSLETLGQCAAVRLFVDRAQAVQLQFVLTEQNAAAVGQVCRRLDGIPLALELAAARMRALSVEQLAARLDQRFHLLTGGSRTALPRQQTLQATVEWSYELLTVAEQTLFTRLSVFAGGFTLEAAEEVCAGGAIAAEDVLDLLARLVDKSLVVAETDAAEAPRYRLLETLRQYGRERLPADTKVTALPDRHAVYYVGLAERFEREQHGPAQGQWLEVLEREHDNLRAALAWCLVQSAPMAGEEASEAVELGARLAGALTWFWWPRGHTKEGRDWLELALSRGDAVGPSLRAKVLHGAGFLACYQTDILRAEELFTQEVTLCREAGDVSGLALALAGLGMTAWDAGDERGADEHITEALALARRSGDRWTIGFVLAYRLVLLTRTDIAPAVDPRQSARAAGEEALGIFQSLEDTLQIAMTKMFLGRMAFFDGEYERAAALCAGSLAVARALRVRQNEGFTLSLLGDIARHQGRHEEAAARYEESVALHRDVGEDAERLSLTLRHLGGLALDRGEVVQAATYIADGRAVLEERARTYTGPGLGLWFRLWYIASLEAHAELAAARGQARRALRLAGAATALRAQTNFLLAPFDQAALARRLAPAREALGAAEQAEVWAAGQALTLEQAIAEAWETPAVDIAALTNAPLVDR